ncbi:MAG: thioredoxin-disulfide reductase [Candidatus Komeilibacteria bacterium]
MNKYDVIVLGSGPAGLTAAIYTSRAELKTLILAGNEPGGQLTTTTDVENFPGFPEGIMGPELMTKMIEQSKRFGAELLNQKADAVEVVNEKEFKVKSGEDEFVASAIILATGATAKWLGLESEQRMRGKGVSACATCDGAFFRDKKVVVVGGGDAAMEEANYLTKFAKEVIVLVRKKEEELRASKIMQERAMNNPKVRFIFSTELKKVLGDQVVTGVKIINIETKEESELEVQGIFVAIGHKPNTDFLQGVVDLKKEYVVVRDNTKTSQLGIFAAGDVADYRYRQAITAAGLGCMAALDVEKYLAE